MNIDFTEEERTFLLAILDCPCLPSGPRAPLVAKLDPSGVGLQEPKIDPGETSDGYHTFNELYAHRHALFTCLLKAHPDISWRSAKAHDGSIMEGWFLAGMHLPTGDISYHLPNNWLANVRTITELERAPEFDGHTSLSVIERLMMFSYGAKGE